MKKEIFEHLNRLKTYERYHMYMTFRWERIHKYMQLTILLFNLLGLTLLNFHMFQNITFYAIHSVINFCLLWADVVFSFKDNSKEHSEERFNLSHRINILENIRDVAEGAKYIEYKKLVGSSKFYEHAVVTDYKLFDKTKKSIEEGNKYFG